jgi:hypothetical protein
MRRFIAPLRALESLSREIVIGVIVAAASPLVLALLTKGHMRDWVAALIAVGTLVAGVLIGSAIGRTRDDASLESKLRELESRTGELGAYETYAEHLRDALRDLRRVAADELPSFSTRDFIEVGIFETAQALLQHDHHGGPRGEVRFSILRPEGDDFAMADGADLFPARGHHVESRQMFRLPIASSFAGVALTHGRVQWSNDLEEDTRFTPHPKASPERSYRSIVSVPLWRSGKVAAVLNVIATQKNAFSSIDRTYVTLLASVIDVAETLKQPPGRA